MGCRDGKVRLWNTTDYREIWAENFFDGPVLHVAFSAANGNIAASSENEPVKLIDSATGKLIRELGVPSKNTKPMAFSPDGRLLAVAVAERVDIYDISASENDLPPHNIERAHTRNVYSVAFTPDGKSLVTSGGDDRTLKQEIKVWNIAAILSANSAGPYNRELKEEVAATSEYSIALSPDGRRVFSRQRQEIVVWDIDTSKIVRTFPTKFNKLVGRGEQLAISPDGAVIAVTGYQSIQLWDLATGLPKQPTQLGHDALVTALTVSATSQTVASASLDATIQLWDRKTGTQLDSLPIPDVGTFHTQTISLSADGNFLAIAGSDTSNRDEPGLLQLWRLKDRSIVSTHRSKRRFNSVALSSDGKLMASIEGDGAGLAFLARGNPGVVFKVFSTESMQEQYSDSLAESRWAVNPYKISFTSDDSKICVISSGGYFEWDIERAGKTTELTFEMDKSLIREPDPFENSLQEAISAKGSATPLGLEVTSADFLSTSGTLYTLSQVSQSYIVPMNNGTGMSRHLRRHRDGAVRIYDSRNGREIQQLRIDRDLRDSTLLAVAPNGKMFATGSQNPSVNKSVNKFEIWSTDTTELNREEIRFRIKNIDLGIESIRTLQFTPDSMSLVAGMNNGTLLIWDSSDLLPK